MKFRALLFSASLIAILFNGLTINTVNAQTNDFLYGDQLPDAPKLSARGEYKVGVKTVNLVNPNQVDILNSKEGNDPTYDRPITIEVWYPANVGDDAKTVVYDEVMGTRGDSLRPLTPFTFKGRAYRDAAPKSGNKFPLVVVSHGYVGSRYLMTYLTENLASKGYIVAAIDHTASTFKDANAFQSTLLNRPKDIRFVINEMEKMGAKGSKNNLEGVVDANNTAIIGYSMGGYGVLNVGGAGYSAGLAQFFTGMTGGSTAISGLKGLKTPTFFIAGSQDDISGYEKGIKAIYEGAVNADRYLLTYMNARHNVAPNPPPAEALAPGLHIDEYYRYAEPSWDQRKMNNINQHFVTAFIGKHLKNQDSTKFLEVQEDSNEKDWTGFKPRSSTGMELLHAQPAN